MRLPPRLVGSRTSPVARVPPSSVGCLVIHHIAPFVAMAEEVRIATILASEQRPRGSCLCRCSATRFTSVHWGGRLLRCGAGVRWRWAKLDLAWEFGSPQATWERWFESRRRSSIPAAAQRRRLGEGGGHEEANGF
jgi:hypothetical protein